MIRIDELSVTSLLLRTFSDDHYLGAATGFVVASSGKFYLVTNWHVLSGRDSETRTIRDPAGRTPNEISIMHHVEGHLGQWVPTRERLVDIAGQTRWIQHPQGHIVDLALLPLEKISGIKLYPLNLELRNTSISLSPSTMVSIVGFPLGNGQAEGLPIWKAAFLASDPDVDYEQKPQMLVDCTGRPGMSGSPVYARRIGNYVDENGTTVVFAGEGSKDKFIGVYAGSIDKLSEIGRVWKASVLMYMLACLRRAAQ